MYTDHLRKVPGSYKIKVYVDMTFDGNSHSLRVGKIYVNEFSSRDDAPNDSQFCKFTNDVDGQRFCMNKLDTRINGL